MNHCDGDKKGYIVVFGTGKYLTVNDADNKEVQSVYGLWDWAEEWVNNDMDDAKRFIVTNRDDSQIELDSETTSATRLTLLTQIVTHTDEKFESITKSTIKWFSPQKYVDLNGGYPEEGGRHVGWYFDLPISGERVVSKTQIRDGKAFVVSSIPSSNLCTTGGSSVLNIFDACSGGQLNEFLYDTNNDHQITDNDDERARKKFDEIITVGTLIEDKLVIKSDLILDIDDETKGMYSWKLID